MTQPAFHRPLSMPTHPVPLPASLPVLLCPIELGVLMQLLDSEDEILVGNAALCLGNCMEVPRAASSLLSTDIVPVLLKLAGSDAQQTAVQLNAGIALGKLCTAEPRCAGPRGAQLLLCRKSPQPTRPGHWGALRLKPARGHSMEQGSFLAPAAIVFSLLSSRSLLFPPPSPPTIPTSLSCLSVSSAFPETIKSLTSFFFFPHVGPKHMEECPIGYILELEKQACWGRVGAAR